MSLPFKLKSSEYKYFLEGKLRVEIKGDVETGIAVETQKQQQKRAIQALTLYEIAYEIANRPVKKTDAVQNDSGSGKWLFLSQDGKEVVERYNSREQATLAWVSAVAGNPGRLNELGHSYAAKFKDMLQNAPTNEEMQMETVAIFIRFRGEYLDDKGNWKELNRWCKKEDGEDWGIKQQALLPYEVTKEIYEVVTNEQSSEETEEREDVPLEKESNLLENQSTTQSTGELSTGESNSVQ